MNSLSIYCKECDKKMELFEEDYGRTEKHTQTYNCPECGILMERTTTYDQIGLILSDDIEYEEKPNCDAEKMEEEIECPRCKGKMRIPDLEEPGASEDGMMPCPTCEGEGTIIKGEEEEEKVFAKEIDDKGQIKIDKGEEEEKTTLQIGFNTELTEEDKEKIREIIEDNMGIEIRYIEEL